MFASLMFMVVTASIVFMMWVLFDVISEAMNKKKKSSEPMVSSLTNLKDVEVVKSKKTGNKLPKKKTSTKNVVSNKKSVKKNSKVK